MKRVVEYEVSKDFDGKTVEYMLKQNGFSTKIITHVKKTEGGITINGNTVRTNHTLLLGETLKVTLIENMGSENIVPVDGSIDIIYEDEDIMVINKKADIPIHPSQGNFYNSLANYVAFYFKEKNEDFTYRCINRLDRNTTGLLIVAKNMLSAAILSKMVSKREIYREYRAIVSGCIGEEGIIDAPIAREEESIITRCVDYNRGDRAITYYRRLQYKNNMSLVGIKLETGRTHQIRVHMKYIGHTLLGDSLYGGDCSKINRQALHSYKLIFQHPITKKKLEFTNHLPNDMMHLIFGDSEN